MRKTYSNENDKLLLTIKDACQITGLCYNTMRKVLNEPSCTFKKKIETEFISTNQNSKNGLKKEYKPK